MKFAFVSIALLSQVLAAPIAAEAGLEKRAIVTVKNTNVVYVKNVVYVDQDGTPYKTEVVPYSTSVIIEEPTQAPAPAEKALPSPTPAANLAAEEEESSPAPEPSPETSSKEAAPAPQPTSEAAPAPSPSPSPSPEPESSSESSPEPSSPSTGGSGSGEHQGEATYYDTGMGACGITSTDSDFIVALNKDMWQAGMIDGNPNHNTLCGKKLTAYRDGKSVTVTVTDMCPGCASGDLDLSPAAFNSLASFSEGRVGVTWSWN